MSAIASVRTDVLSLHRPTTVVRNVEGRANEAVDLSAHDLWRLEGDSRWRMVICVRGEIWVTQERDPRDYVLTAGDMLIVTQSGSVLIGALCDASLEITPSLKSAPYRGHYPVFQ